MRIYIAGPMRHKVDKNRPAFEAAASDLRRQGHQPINPFDLCTAEEIAAQENDVTPALCRRFARRDIDAIIDSDAIYMLEGWETSIGARAEHAVAIWCQLHLLYQTHSGISVDHIRRIAS